MGIITDKILAPSQFVLQSFNLLDKSLAKNLTGITNYLTDIRSETFKSNLPDHITQQTAQQNNTAAFTTHKTMQSSYESIAATFGVSGNYGFYSGSVQASGSSQEYQKATAFSSSCVGTVKTGTTYLNQTQFDAANVSDYFDSAFVKTLGGVNSLATAQSFVNQYGTHIGLGWNLGGSFSIQVSAATSSYSDKLGIEAAVKGAYQSVNSVSASASAAYELNQKGSQYNFDQQTTVAGGSAAAAGAIDLKSPGANIGPWLASCTTDTTYGLYQSMTMADLAHQIGKTTAASMLQQYVDLYILKHSLENPTIISNYKSLQQGTTVGVTVTPADVNYKIVGGGAAISSRSNANSYITGSFPETKTLPNGELGIISWTATSHDCMQGAVTSNYLTSYAFAVYDPGNYLNVFVSAYPGTNSGEGYDSANGTSVHGLCLTGGGLKTEIIAGSFVKYMVSNGPKKVQGTWNSWEASVQDYVQGATNVSLTGYAIGISCKELNITSNVYPLATTQAQEHGNQIVSLDTGNLIGGGVVLGTVTQGNGNLVRQTYPSDAKTWTEFNTDLNASVSPCVATAYAIGVVATINGVN